MSLPLVFRAAAQTAFDGAALVDQVKSLGWQARKAAPICTVPAEVVAQVLRRLHALLGKD
jgi:mRNA-degrading endonuclease toxin of MazEF toxin-antitoxin module